MLLPFFIYRLTVALDLIGDLLLLEEFGNHCFGALLVCPDFIGTLILSSDEYDRDVLVASLRVILRQAP